MKRILLAAILMIVAMLFAVPVVLAQAETPDEKTIGLIWMSGAWIAQFVVGMLVKKIPDVPNELIPIITTLVGLVGFTWLLDMPLKAAVILAMATAHGATIMAEGKTLVAKHGGAS